jgi:Uma2 family endonuclease
MKVKETAQAYRAEKKIYTYQDYANLPDDRNLYEILKGELVMTPSPITIHQRMSSILFNMFFNFIEKQQIGEIFSAPFDVVLNATNVVQPDIIFISNDNKQIITEKNIQGAPDLIIEILSPSTAYYDLIDKKEIYETFGVKEYWIVDPKKQWIEIYILKDLHRRADKTGKIQSHLLKEFEIELKAIFK